MAVGTAHIIRRDYASRMKEICDRVDGKVEQVYRNVILDLTAKVIDRSPVWQPTRFAPHGGHFRANWRLAAGSPDTSTTDTRDPSGALVLNELHAKLNGISDILNQRVYLTNSLPYARVIEFGEYPNPPKRGTYLGEGKYEIRSVGGFSKQAPTGVVRVTALEVDAIVDAAVAEARKA